MPHNPHTYGDDSPACTRCGGEVGFDVGTDCPGDPLVFEFPWTSEHHGGVATGPGWVATRTPFMFLGKVHLQVMYISGRGRCRYQEAYVPFDDPPRLTAAIKALQKFTDEIAALAAQEG